MLTIQTIGHITGDAGYRTIGDESPTLTGAERLIGIVSTLTAPRSCTLPASATYQPDSTIRFTDIVGGISGGDTFTIAVATGDSLNGTLNGTLVMNAARQSYSLTTDGAGNWVYVQGSASVGTTSITGTAATFPITGQAAAQGGSIAISGGTSSTSGNAGGAASLTGGTPGATGIGGAASVVGGVGGATSGAGGAASLTGGAATNGNAAGGAASVTGGVGHGTSAGGAASLIGGAAGTTTNAAGGAVTITGGLGHGSSAGGAVTITSGAAGATGVAGAITIAVGAATAGNGSALTLNGGNGAGGTASGGNINLIPGTAVSTGVPGVIQVNSVSGLFDACFVPPLATTVVPASGTSQMFFLATRAYYCVAASCIEVTHGTSETIDVIHDTSTGAAGSGTSILTAPMDPHAASLTVVTGTLTSTVATLLLAPGDRLSFKAGGTVGSAAGLMVSVTLVPA